MSYKVETCFRGFTCLAALVVLGAVLILLGFLGARGVGAFNPALFFGEATPWAVISGRAPASDGLWPACLGTLYLVLLSCLLALPVGVASGVYLAQFAGDRGKKIITLAVDLLAGMPSILMGLFGFALILFLRQLLGLPANTGLLLAAGCLALLVLPYLVFTTRTALESLPETIKITGPSLGFSPLQNLVHVLLPAAGRGILSGIILAVGRAAEDTAVIMLTGVVANAGVPGSLTGKFEALPFKIFYLAAEHRTPEELAQAFGAALTLLLLTGAIFLAAHVLQRTMAGGWKGGFGANRRKTGD